MRSAAGLSLGVRDRLVRVWQWVVCVWSGRVAALEQGRQQSGWYDEVSGYDYLDEP